MDDFDRLDKPRLPRESDWQRRLGRLRLGAEPLALQLRRYRRSTLVATAIAVAIGATFTGLFAAFRRIDIGITLALVLMGPIVAIAWLDHLRLRRRAHAYLCEVRALHAGKEREDPA